MKKLPLLLLVGLLGCASLAWGQDATAQPSTPFRAGVNLGTDVLLTGPGATPESWTVFGFQPDVGLGKFGVGLNLTLHFQIYPVNDPGNAVAIYPGDWVPEYKGSGQNFFDLYLPKILYVRYGLKGQDPLYAKVGSIGDFTLGNGFIMGNYSNMAFFPERRISGLDAGLDGAMFDFPYLGVELLTGNLARLDVVGLHLLGRPMISTDLPLLKDLQVGLTFVTDTDPGLYTSEALTGVSVFGFDAMMPILNKDAVTMAAFTETAFEPQRLGFMAGVGGQLVKMFNYGLQLRILGAGFIPDYFDANYDIYRSYKAKVMAVAPAGSAAAGWYASIGTSLLGDKISAVAALDGPFVGAAGSTDQAQYPHFRAVAHLGEGLLPGIYADATYEKYYLGKYNGFFADLVDRTDAIANLAINYKTGSSVLTLLYNAKWVNNDWQVTSSLQAALKF